jgi:hypothetical protein
MLRRLLNLLGFGMPLIDLPPDAATATLTAGGPPTFAFVPGPAGDASESTLPTTWPGKIETIRVANWSDRVYRFEMTITGLSDTLYARRPPVGAPALPSGGVLLQPGEECLFSVEFLLPRGDEAAGPQAFKMAARRFDPQHPNDGGELFEERALLWAPTPDHSALKVVAWPGRIVTRPWRRAAMFWIAVTNDSDLPPRLDLEAHRIRPYAPGGAPPEKIGTLEQTLRPRTDSGWVCILPHTSAADRYLVSVRGAARFGGAIDVPLTLAHPVHVRYVPWLRSIKDWLSLSLMLVLAAWVAWGFLAHR